MYVDFNNNFYAENFAIAIVEHLNRLPNPDCCPHHSCCKTCRFIKTMMEVGSLDSVIETINKMAYDYPVFDFWDKKLNRVNYRWIENRWMSCPVQRQRDKMERELVSG